MSVSKTDPMMGARPSERGMRDSIEKIKAGVSQAVGGMMGMEQSLRKISTTGGATVSQDELIIALSKIGAQMTLDEIKDFFKVV